MSEPNDRWAPKAERLARKIEPCRSAIVTVELVHAATESPFTAVECKDAQGNILTGDDRGGIPVYELAAFLSRYFASVSVDDRGMAATFIVRDPLPPAPEYPDERDRFRPMAELVERSLVRHRDVIATVVLHHVPSDGGPFTSVTLKDASDQELDSCDRSGFATLDAHRLLERYFEHVRVEDHGLHVRSEVSLPRTEPLPRR